MKRRKLEDVVRATLAKALRQCGKWCSNHYQRVGNFALKAKNGKIFVRRGRHSVSEFSSELEDTASTVISVLTNSTRNTRPERLQRAVAYARR